MDPNVEAIIASMKEEMKSQQKQMQSQQDQFLKVLETLQAGKTEEKSAPKFDEFDSNKEKWQQYLERFQHHLNIYDISSDEKKRACLLSWIGAQTYELLENLFGDKKISQQSYKDLTTKLSTHFQDSVHVQAGRYAFYNCKMQTGESYMDWAARLKGLAKYCDFVCKRTLCNQTSYVDEQNRDVIIKETPHADVRRQCL